MRMYNTVKEGKCVCVMQSPNFRVVVAVLSATFVEARSILGWNGRSDHRAGWYWCDGWTIGLPADHLQTNAAATAVEAVVQAPVTLGAGQVFGIHHEPWATISPPSQQVWIGDCYRHDWTGSHHGRTWDLPAVHLVTVQVLRSGDTLWSASVLFIKHREREQVYIDNCGFSRSLNTI